MTKMDINSTCNDVAYQGVFRDYAKAIRNFVYAKCGNISAAEDITQDAFVKLWQKCKEVPLDKAKSFLYAVANNLFIDQKRHEKVVLNYQGKANISGISIESPHFQLEEKEFKHKIEKVINSMPEKSRVVFLMNRIEKLTYKEIAERLEISQKAVEKRMHKSLSIMREQIGRKV